MIANNIYSFKDPDNPDLLIQHGFQQEEPFYVGTNAGKAIFIPLITDLAAYYGTINNYSDNFSGALKEIELSGLRGRGGAGFPFYIKLEAAAKEVSDTKYVICNADEGDPGAFSDKWLLEKRPHSMLFGMIMTGLICGAETGVIYIRGEYPEAVKSVNQAIGEFEVLKPGLIGISGKELNFTFHLITGAGAYICGEETSLINSIEGLRPEVRTRPPFPATYGLFGKPTVLSNVETFSNLRYILSEGGLSYSSLGTGKSTGTKLVSLDGAFNNPGIFEVVMGTTLRELFSNLGGGTKYPVKAFQVGGPLGGIVPADIAMDLTLDFESFAGAGFLLGHAGVVSIPEDFPMIDYLEHLFEFTSRESCGKCFPCRIGAQRGYELLKAAREKGRKINYGLFQDLLETMQLGSLCALGGGVSLPVFNALQYFSSELGEHFQNMIENR
jgi:NADH:ubiquinone oxidoreductase subunit F (NADH-binding)